MGLFWGGYGGERNTRVQLRLTDTQPTRKQYLKVRGKNVSLTLMVDSLGDSQIQLSPLHPVIKLYPTGLFGELVGTNNFVLS